MIASNAGGEVISPSSTQVNLSIRNLIFTLSFFRAMRFE
jgi:hypothetical protein